ncbi:GreA/GreB family elongation factor [Pseudorhizobium flavum]|uniref:GreA/GreB family elongation factor n=1 Tax=Pseudorhizobium flavum TaxID=1335061 RepID=UPI00376F9EA2
MRLSTLAQSARERGLKIATLLIEELERAWISPDEEVKPETVRVGSTVTFVTLSGESKTVRLVYPGETDVAASQVSVLSNVGVALLGLSKGDTVHWLTWEHRENSLTLVDVMPPVRVPTLASDRVDEPLS